METKTDLDRFKTLMTEFGVVFTEEEKDGRVRIKIDEGAGPKNKGYLDFYTSYFFFADGSFDHMGAWE